MATKWCLKSCPVCSGDLYIDTLWKEEGLQCLQCGRPYRGERLLEMAVAGLLKGYGRTIYEESQVVAAESKHPV